MIQLFRSFGMCQQKNVIPLLQQNFFKYICIVLCVSLIVITFQSHHELHKAIAPSQSRLFIG
jgi:hypothetical protein